MPTLALPTFNPLQFSKRLKEAGVPESQAEAEAEALNEVLTAQTQVVSDLGNQLKTLAADAKRDAGQMATKGDLAEVRNALKGDLAEVRNELKADVAEVRNELKADIAEVRGDITLLKWMLGITLAGIGAIFAKLFLG